ncbi:hypothetical protein ES708_14306 [subsurface metagenome]
MLTERLHESKLDFRVVSKRIYLSGTNTIDDIPVQGQRIESHFATVREDTGDVLGIVGNRYEIIQNAEALGIADFMDGDFKHARAVDNGAIVSVALDIGNFRIGDDELNKRLFLRTSHNGSCAVEVRMQVLRVVCTNGLVAWRNKSVVKIRHTKSYQQKLAEARRVLGIADEYYKKLNVDFQRLIETPLYPEQQQGFLDKLIGKPDASKKRDCITPTRERILSRLHTSPDLANHRNNAWGMYNAVAAYVDHQRGAHSSEDNQYAMRNWGTGYELKNKAFDLLMV